MSVAQIRGSQALPKPNIRHLRLTRAGRLPQLLPGLALVAIIALAAQALSLVLELALGRVFVEGLVLSMLLGLFVRTIRSDLRQFDPGAAFASKQLLEGAVILLGAGMNAGLLAALGPRLATLIPLGVVLALVIGFGIGRIMGLGPRLALLVAVGNAICGNSAIVAVAPIVKAEKHEVASSIALTAVIGIGLVLLLPLLIPLAGLSVYQYGVVVGMGVYAVPQVVAAAFPVSEVSGQIATSVKLGRVLMLGPMILAVGMMVALLRTSNERRTLPWRGMLPWFVVGFVLMAALRVGGVLPDAVAHPARQLGSWLTVMAMAGLGLGVRLPVIRSVGPRVALAVFGSLFALIALTLALIRLLAVDA